LYILVIAAIAQLVKAVAYATAFTSLTVFIRTTTLSVTEIY